MRVVCVPTCVLFQVIQKSKIWIRTKMRGYPSIRRIRSGSVSTPAIGLPKSRKSWIVVKSDRIIIAVVHRLALRRAFKACPCMFGGGNVTGRLPMVGSGVLWGAVTGYIILCRVSVSALHHWGNVIGGGVTLCRAVLASSEATAHCIREPNVLRVIRQRLLRDTFLMVVPFSPGTFSSGTHRYSQCLERVLKSLTLGYKEARRTLGRRFPFSAYSEVSR